MSARILAALFLILLIALMCVRSWHRLVSEASVDGASSEMR